MIEQIYAEENDHIYIYVFVPCICLCICALFPYSEDREDKVIIIRLFLFYYTDLLFDRSWFGRLQ